MQLMKRIVYCSGALGAAFQSEGLVRGEGVHHALRQFIPMHNMVHTHCGSKNVMLFTPCPTATMDLPVADKFCALAPAQHDWLSQPWYGWRTRVQHTHLHNGVVHTGQVDRQDM